MKRRKTRWGQPVPRSAQQHNYRKKEREQGRQRLSAKVEQWDDEVLKKKEQQQ